MRYVLTRKQGRDLAALEALFFGQLAEYEERAGRNGKRWRKRGKQAAELALARDRALRKK